MHTYMYIPCTCTCIYQLKNGFTIMVSLNTILQSVKTCIPSQTQPLIVFRHIKTKKGKDNDSFIARLTQTISWIEKRNPNQQRNLTVNIHILTPDEQIPRIKKGVKGNNKTGQWPPHTRLVLSKGQTIQDDP